ncbi:hypothetical protein LINGRAHAP2_LOCUS33369 [Linum grandiflorum]
MSGRSSIGISTYMPSRGRSGSATPLPTTTATRISMSTTIELRPSISILFSRLEMTVSIIGTKTLMKMNTLPNMSPAS